MSESLSVIVLAAGAGTRMKSRRAKVLHHIGGRSLVEHAITAVRGLDADRLAAVIGHDRDQVAQAVSALGPDIVQAVQAEQRGTGDAVQVGLTALEAASGEQQPVQGTVLITYADVPLLNTETLRALLEEHRSAERAVTILSANRPDPNGYGRIIRDPAGRVQAICEDRDASDAQREINEVNSGILAVDADFLRDSLAGLDTSNAQGELYLTDIVADAVQRGRPVGAHVLEDVWQTEGVNDRAQLASVGAELNRRLTGHWMREGVTIVDPSTTWIDSDVSLAADVTLLPGTQLLGATSVGEGAQIGPDTTLRNVEVGIGASVVRSHGSDSVIGPDASVGPFAYLRPAAELAAGAKVGTFVEIKNSRLGEAAKVPHLSYVGDADVGAGSNIGAGTIVANYDGVKKHRTVVGEQVRTGSSNVFVAPVSIDDGAYTGAGTVVRDDVPAGALAVTGAQQRTIEGWVQRKRPGTLAAQAAKGRARE